MDDDDNKGVGMCAVCGGPGTVHLTEIRGDEKLSKSFCLDHVPEALRQPTFLPPGQMSMKLLAFLRQQLSDLDVLISDPERRAKSRAFITQAIADLEAGRSPGT